MNLFVSNDPLIMLPAIFEAFRPKVDGVTRRIENGNFWPITCCFFLELSWESLIDLF